MNNNLGVKNFIQSNSPDGDFLQSPEWRKFQEIVGRKTFSISSDNFQANIVEHALPMVGKYFYIPRGPIVSDQEPVNSEQEIKKLIELAKENNAGWIRIEPATDEILEAFRSNTGYKIVKAPHDMQPRELFIIDITKPEEQLLSEMKSKTRYNIRVAQKHGVSIKVAKSYISEFLRLVNVTSCRNKITCHQESYYQKMLEVIPEDILKLYVAEYDGKVIVANLVVLYGQTCTYLHGASDDEYRNVMAPFLLQWQQIKDAASAGYEKYDFGGVKIRSKKQEVRNKKNSWEGITRFKTGFSPDTRPTEFPGCYDIVINPVKYWLYRSIQSIKSLIK
jgi:lipid II:glycine glycyltransferase (peptidoglycan interpeptide bridge formation enzyme)